jgi:hypothetical protein
MKAGTRVSLRPITLAAMVILAFVSTSQATVRIGGWALTGNGQVLREWEYSGPCPVDLKFQWGVLSTEPTRVNYTFTRSDGARQSEGHNINIPRADQSQSITEDWHLGANTAEFANFKGWLQLDIETPNRVARRIEFTLHCGGGGGEQSSMRVGGESLRANGQVAQGFQYRGACPVNLQFGWGIVSSSAEEIRYTFVRNDGGHLSTPKTARLRGDNQSTPIYDEWQLGTNNAEFANYSGWVQLEVEAPRRLVSKIGFTIHCQ